MLKVLIKMKVIYFFIRYVIYFLNPLKKIKFEVPASKSNILDILHCVNENYEEIPKRIWIYWEGKSKPNYVSFFINKIREKNPEHQVLFLDESNISDYLPFFKVDNSVSILPAHKSDVIRLMLLKNYGGIWLDATILLNRDLGWIHSIDRSNNYDLIGYYRKVSTKNLENPVIENWLMAAKKNNKFISSWLDELLPIIDLGSKGYWQRISKDENFDKIKQGISNPEYLLAYLAAQKVQLNLKDSLNFYLKCCEEDAFFLQRTINWRPHKIAYLLSIYNCENLDFELIKLTGSDRLLINIIKKTKFFSKKSLLSGYYLKRKFDV